MYELLIVFHCSCENVSKRCKKIESENLSIIIHDSLIILLYGFSQRQRF